MIHAHSGIRLYVTSRRNLHYYNVVYIQKYNGKDVYIPGIANVGQLVRKYVEIAE